MTSAKQWSDNSAGIEPGYPAHVRVIRDIQMEAYKAGMTRAAEMVVERGQNCPTTRGLFETGWCAFAGGMPGIIAHARDNLKPEDVK